MKLRMNTKAFAMLASLLLVLSGSFVQADELEIVEGTASGQGFGAVMARVTGLASIDPSWLREAKDLAKAKYEQEAPV